MAKNNMTAAKNTVILFMAIILRHIVAAYATMKVRLCTTTNYKAKASHQPRFFDCATLKITKKTTSEPSISCYF